MITPQEIEQVAFNRATFGGYDMQAVDEFLEPLTEDYITLYKENALLKSKMKVLVSKLEEYRANEASLKEAAINAQKTCDAMVKDAEAKCAQMLSDANALAAENAKNADALIIAENERVEEARQAAFQKISEMESQLDSCLQALSRIKEANLPIHKPSGAFDYEQSEKGRKGSSDADAVAEEISANLEALVGSTEELAPKPEPRHPVSDTTTKFANLQFGRNYDPSNP